MEGDGSPSPAPLAKRRAADLAERIARREDKAILEVQDQYGRVIGRYLRSTLRDEGEAEDVMQQVLVEVWQRGPQYDPRRGSLLTWIMTIARSRAIDRLRRRVPEPRDPDVALAAVDTATADGVDDLVERWRLAEILSRIPAQEAEALRLRFYEGLAQPQIAERMDLPLGTVKTRMVAGLVRLRELMAEEEGA